MDSVAGTTRKGRGFADAEQSQVAKEVAKGGAPSVPVADPPTRRKGRGFADAGQSQVAKRGAALPSVKATNMQKKGRSFAGAVLKRVVKRGAASSSTDDTTTAGRMGRRLPDATKIQVAQNDTTSASSVVSIVTTGGTETGFADAAHKRLVKRVAASASTEGTTTAGRKGRGLLNAALSQVAKSGTASASSAIDTAMAGGRKGGSFVDAISSNVDKRVASSSFTENVAAGEKGRGFADPPKSQVGKTSEDNAPMRRKGRGFLDAARSQGGKSGATCAPVVNTAMAGRRSRSFADDSPRQVETSSVAPSLLDNTTMTRRKGRGFADAERSQLGKSGAASASMDNTAVTAKKGRGLLAAAQSQVVHSGTTASATVEATATTKEGPGISSVARAPVGERDAASSSLGDTTTTKQGRRLSNAAPGQVGKSGAASASAESTAMRGKREKIGRSNAGGSAPVDRRGSDPGDGGDFRQVGQSNTASACSGYTTTTTKGRGLSNAARSPAGHSGASFASTEGTAARGKNGRIHEKGSVSVEDATAPGVGGRVSEKGSVPGACRGSGRGNNGDTFKPSSPKSNTIGGSISIAAGKRQHGKSGTANKRSGGSASVKPASLRGPQKDLALSKCEFVSVSSSSQQATIENADKRNCTEWGVRARGAESSRIREDKEQHKAPFGAEDKRRLVEASTPDGKNADSVAEVPAVAGDKVAAGQAEPVLDGEEKDGSNGKEAAAAAAAAATAEASPADLVALTVMETPEVAVPADANHAAGEKTPCVVKGKEGTVGAFGPNAQGVETVTGEAATPADQLADGQADAVQDDEEGSEEEKEIVATIRMASVVPVTQEVVETPEIAEPPDVGHATNVEQSCVAESTSHIMSAQSKKPLAGSPIPEERDPEAVAEASVVPGDKVVAAQAGAILNGEEVGGEEEGEEQKAAADVPAAGVALVTSAVVETSEVAVPAGASHAKTLQQSCGAESVGRLVAAEGTERSAGAPDLKELDPEAVTLAAASSTDKLTAAQVDAFQDGRKNGREEEREEEEKEEEGREEEERRKEEGEEEEREEEETAAAVPVATVGTVIPEVVETPEVGVLADVGHATNVEQSCATEIKECLVEAEGSEDLVEALAHKERDAEAATLATASSADKVAAARADDFQDGKEDDREEEGGGGEDEEGAAAAVPVASVAPVAPEKVETPGIAVPIDVGHATNVEQSCVTEDTGRLLEAEDTEGLVAVPAHKEQDAEAVVEAAAGPADKLGVDQKQAVEGDEEDVGRGGKERAAAVVEPAATDPATPGVVKTPEVTVPIDVSRAVDVETSSIAEGAEPLMSSPFSRKQGALARAPAASADDFVTNQAEVFYDGDKGDEEAAAAVQSAAAAPTAPAVVATPEVALPIDVSRAASMETLRGVASAEPLIGPSTSRKQGTEALAQASAALMDHIAAGDAEAFLDDEEDGATNGGEVAAAVVAAPAVAEPPKACVPFDVSHAASMEFVRRVEGAESLMGLSVSRKQGAGAVAEAPAALVHGVSAGEAGALRHDEEKDEDDGTKYGEEAAAAAVATAEVQAVVATPDFGVPTDVSQAAYVETSRGVGGKERVVEAFDPKEQGAEVLAEVATALSDGFVTSEAETVQNGEQDREKDDAEATEAGPASARAPAAVAAVDIPEVSVPVTVTRTASLEAACSEEGTDRVAGAHGAESTKRLAGASISQEKDPDALPEAPAATQADNFATGQEVVQGETENGVEALAAKTIQATGGRHRGRGWWKRLVASTGVVVLTVLLGVAGISMCQGSEIPPACGRKTVLFADGPLKPGECMESDGGSRWFGWVAGIGWKSRLHASEDGGTYIGPDGTKVSLRNVDWEMNVGGGVFCSAERFVRKVTRLGGARYGVSPRDASPVPGNGLFCRPKATISTPSVLILPRRGTAHFSESDDLEIVNSRGKVLWSAADGIGLRREGEKGSGKHSSDVSKAKHDKKGRKKEERENKQTGEKKPDKANGGKRGWNWGRSNSGGDEHARNKPAAGQGRGIGRILSWVRRLYNK